VGIPFKSVLDWLDGILHCATFTIDVRKNTGGAAASASRHQTRETFEPIVRSDRDAVDVQTIPLPGVLLDTDQQFVDRYPHREAGSIGNRCAPGTRRYAIAPCQNRAAPQNFVTGRLLPRRNGGMFCLAGPFRRAA
jgi:hypothetical protein